MYVVDMCCALHKQSMSCETSVLIDSIGQPKSKSNISFHSVSVDAVERREIHLPNKYQNNFADSVEMNFVKVEMRLALTASRRQLTMSASKSILSAKKKKKTEFI